MWQRDSSRMAWSTCPKEPNNQNKPGNHNNPKKTPINGTDKPIPYNGFEVGLLVYDQGGELHQTVMSPIGDMPVAVKCHGPWTIVDVDVLNGRRLKSWPSLKRRFATRRRTESMKRSSYGATARF